MKVLYKSIFVKFPLAFWISLALMGLFSLILSYGLVSEMIFSDYSAHLGIYKLYREMGKFPFPPGYFFAFSSIAKLIPGDHSLKIGMFAITVISILGRYYLSYQYLLNQFSKNRSAWFALGLMIFAPVYFFEPQGSNYLFGKYSTSFWHSGTLTLVWPFCILLFFQGLYFVKKGSAHNLLYIYLISIPILLIKPSFLFSFVPVFPLFAFWEKGRGKVFIQASGYALLIFALILLEKWWVFEANSLDPFIYGAENTNKVKILPFAVWKYFSQSPVKDFFSSFLFLLIALSFWGRKLYSQSDFRFAFLLSLIGVLIYLVFAEAGPRFSHGNFGWQIPIGLFLLYLSVLRFLLNNWDSLFSQSTRFKMLLVLGAFLIHCLSGINYLVHYSQTGYYF